MVYNATFLKGDQSVINIIIIFIIIVILIREHIIASLCNRIVSPSFRHYEVIIIIRCLGNALIG